MSRWQMELIARFYDEWFMYMPKWYDEA